MDTKKVERFDIAIFSRKIQQKFWNFEWNICSVYKIMLIFEHILTPIFLTFFSGFSWNLNLKYVAKIVISMKQTHKSRKIC